MNTKKDRRLKVLTTILLIIVFIFLEASWNFEQYVAPLLGEDASVGEMVQVYSALNAQVDEEELITAPVLLENEESVNTKIENSSMTILSQTALESITSIEQFHFLPTNEIVFTQAEFASLFNSIINKIDYYDALFNKEEVEAEEMVEEAETEEIVENIEETEMTYLEEETAEDNEEAEISETTEYEEITETEQTETNQEESEEERIDFNHNFFKMNIGSEAAQEIESTVSFFSQLKEFDLKIVSFKVIKNVEQLQEGHSLSLEAVVKINLSSLNLPGFLVPEKVFVKIVLNYETVEHNYNAVEGTITLNNLDQETTQKIVNIASTVANFEQVNLVELSEEVASQFMQAFDFMQKYLNISVSFNEAEVVLTPNTILYTETKLKETINEFIESKSIREILNLDLAILDQLQATVEEVVLTGGSTPTIRIEIDTNLTELKKTVDSAARLIIPNSPNFIVTIDFNYSNNTFEIDEVELRIKNMLNFVSTPILNAVLKGISINESIQDFETIIGEYAIEYIPKINGLLNRNIVVNNNVITFELIE